MTLSLSGFSQKDIEIIQEETPFTGFFRVKRYRIRHKLFAGGWSNVMEREVFDRETVAAVLPYDPARDQVVLIEQMRAGTLHSAKPWLLEIVAGIVEEGESPEKMAHREGLEETGLHFSNLKKIIDYWVSPGGSSEFLSLFLGEVDASTASGIHGAEHEDEDIKVHVVSRQDAFQAVQDGVINNAATIIALQWLQLQHLKQEIS